MPPSAALDLTFSALADPTRRAILARLASGEATVGELAEPFAISLPAISRHLSVLERARLIERSRDGQHRRCRLNPAPIGEAAQWLAFYRRFWEGSFERLAAHLQRSSAKEEKAHGRKRATRRRRR
jgi:DNA-binding transcriptional ArsR family regulator